MTVSNTSLCTGKLCNARTYRSVLSYTTSDQHKDVSKARQERDIADTLEVLEYLTPRSPFGGNSTLHSIALGITADATVHGDCAQQVGKKVLEGKTTAQHTFKKKDQVCPLSNSNTINVRDEVIHINPQLLFQRLVTAGQ